MALLHRVLLVVILRVLHFLAVADPPLVVSRLNRQLAPVGGRRLFPQAKQLHLPLLLLL